MVIRAGSKDGGGDGQAVGRSRAHPVSIDPLQSLETQHATTTVLEKAKHKEHFFKDVFLGVPSLIFFPIKLCI
jgi:hypothetical protein